MHLVASVQRNYTRERFCSTLLDLLTAIGLHMSTCEKITRKKSHVYLELSAKRASIRTYINMHAWKKLAKDTACTPEKNHLGLLLDLSSKDTAIELMYINMHVQGNFWNWKLLKIRLMYRNHAHALIGCRTLDKQC